jgi:Arc/MetJ-type ribon-helix-helix transcriptional regulator
MSKTKVAITIEQPLLAYIDQLVAAQIFPNRSRAIEDAIEEQLERLEHGRLARECAKLNPAFEQALAEEGFVGNDRRAGTAGTGAESGAAAVAKPEGQGGAGPLGHRGCGVKDGD